MLVTGATGWVGSWVVGELLSTSRAVVHCLVRDGGAGVARPRLFQALLQHGVVLDPDQASRVVIVPGDASAPNLGLDGTVWRRLSEAVDAIYHLAASVSMLADYSSLCATNVTPLAALVTLATANHVKPIWAMSPMAVSRRHRRGASVVLPDETASESPDGLATGYAQSKWVVEHVLLAASRRVPVRIFRTSHALASSGHAVAKADDTYAAIFEAACEAGVVPDWEDSAVYGVPVDVLSRLLVRDTLSGETHRGIVHLENRTPPSMRAVVEAMLEGRGAAVGHLPPVPLAEWKVRCIAAADLLHGARSTLAKALFATRAIEHMFAGQPIRTDYFEERGLAADLEGVTPRAYWQSVGRSGAPSPAPSAGRGFQTTTSNTQEKRQ